MSAATSSTSAPHISPLFTPTPPSEGTGFMSPLILGPSLTTPTSPPLLHPTPLHPPPVAATGRKRFFQTLKMPSFHTPSSSPSTSTASPSTQGGVAADKGELGGEKKGNRPPQSAGLGVPPNGKSKLERHVSDITSFKPHLGRSNKHTPPLPRSASAQENRHPTLSSSPELGPSMVETLIPTLAGLGLNLDLEELRSPESTIRNSTASKKPVDLDSTISTGRKEWAGHRVVKEGTNGASASASEGGKRRALADIRWGPAASVPSIGSGSSKGEGGDKMKERLAKWRGGGKKGREEGSWVISVAMEEWKGGKREEEEIDWKKGKFVVYASNPSHQMTLIRKTRDLVELHEYFIKSNLSSILIFPEPLRFLINTTITPSSPPKPTKSSFLSRFRPKSPDPASLVPLSPPLSIGRSSSFFEPAEGSIGVFQFEKGGDTGDLGLLKTTAAEMTPSHSGELGGRGKDTISRGEAFALISAMAEDEALASKVTSPVLNAAPLGSRPSNLDLESLGKEEEGHANGNPVEDGERHQTLTALSRYLTTCANTPLISHTQVWQNFMLVRSSDLVSGHTRERSDEWIDVAGLGYDLDSVDLTRSASNGHAIGEKERKKELRKSRSIGGGMMLGLFNRSNSAVGVFGESITEKKEEIKEESEKESGTPTPIAKDVHPIVVNNSEGPEIKIDTGSPIPVMGISVEETTVSRTISPIPELEGLPKVDSATLIREKEMLDEALPETKTTVAKVQDSAVVDSPQRRLRESAPSPEMPDTEQDNVDQPSNEAVGEEVVADEAVEESAEKASEAEQEDAPAVPRKTKGRSGPKVTVDDFELIRVLGKGCAGKVVLVKHKKSQALFAMKAIIKRHVIAHQELTHTLTEQSVLKRMAKEREGDPNKNPFIVKLYWSFHDSDNLYLILDFHPGGDLATQLARWGRLGRDRARFYTSEIVEGVESLHAAGVIYRDLKPENAILGADGHIVLVDFGLAAEFPGSEGPLASVPHWMGGTNAEEDGRPKMQRHVTTDADVKKGGRDQATSFVGTAEYLAPEVIKGLPYSYEVDWWSLGTMLYEALIGHTPFWVDNHSEMYMRVVHEELTFPEDRQLDKDTKSFIRGLLQKDPAFRLCEPRIKKHPYLAMVDFDHVRHKRYIPPYIPPTDDTLEYDIQNFDQTFLSMEPTVKEDTSTEEAETPEQTATAEATPKDAFDGYDFRDKAIISVVMEEASDDEHADVAPSAPPKPSIDQLLTAAATQTAPEATEEDRPTTRPAAIDNDGPLPRASLEALARTEAPSIKVPSLIDPEDIALRAQHKGTVKSSRHSRDMSALIPDIKRTGSPSGSVEGGDADAEDDWDLIEETPAGEERNGGRRSRARETFFARGVVDRYKLAVLKRRESTVRKRISSARLRKSPSSSMFLDPMSTSATSLAGLRSRFRSKPKGSRAGHATPPVSNGVTKYRTEKPLPSTGTSDSHSVTSSTVSGSRGEQITDEDDQSESESSHPDGSFHRRMSEPRVSLGRRTSVDKGRRGSSSVAAMSRSRMKGDHGVEGETQPLSHSESKEP